MQTGMWVSLDISVKKKKKSIVLLDNQAQL